jgi:hypothetical protein
MYAYSSFPSRFAVFRGPYHSTLRTELVVSTMIFDTTPSADESFYTATLRPWFGTIVGDDNIPDKTVRTVKIHSPLRANQYGIPFNPSNERFVVLPFCLESQIPILAFESNNWMPRFKQVMHLTHKIQGDSFKYHFQNINYVASALMRTTAPLPPYITWLQSLPDPYAQMNRAEIRAIPYNGLSAINIHTLRRDIIMDYHQRNTVAGEVIDTAVAATVATVAAAPAALPPAVDYDDYSSMFDAAAGYVAPAEMTEEPPTIPAFILENHLAHEVQKGTECPITFEPLISLAEVAMSPDCGHFFEQEALKAWGKVQQSAGTEIVCPVCRKALNQVVTMTNKSYIPPIVT